MEENERFYATTKGIETAFRALIKLLEGGKLTTDEYVVLDIYMRMFYDISTEDKLKSLMKAPLIMVNDSIKKEISFRRLY